MLANPYDKMAAKWRASISEDEVARSYIIQPKYDGVWVAILPDGSVISRVGKPITSLPPSMVDRLRTKHLVVIGEALVLDKPFACSSGQVRRKTVSPDLTVIVHDAVCWERWQEGEDDETPYADRLYEVTLMWPYHAPGRLANPKDAAALQALGQDWASRDGYDGIIAKDPKAYYRRRRSDRGEAIKYKGIQSETFEVVGATVVQQPTKLGGFITVDVGDGKTTDVGSGLTQAQLAELQANPLRWNGLLAEVEFMERTEDGKLREPRFLGLRAD